MVAPVEDGAELAMQMGEAKTLSDPDQELIKRARSVIQYRDTGLISIRRWTELEMGPFKRRANQVINAIGEEAHRVPSLAKELQALFGAKLRGGMGAAQAMECVNRLCRTIIEANKRTQKNQDQNQ